jgi:two-component system sensor histidine kinase TctE
MQPRSAFAHGLLLQAAALDALLIISIALLMMAGVVYALRPLNRLQKDIQGRDQDDLTPIDTACVPAEVRPLVAAVNHHVERSSKLLRSQRQFLDDASHQLRTPLAVLVTQVGYALREPEMPRVREALTAMERGLNRASRLVNQMLALARINNAVVVPDSMESFELNGIVEETARLLLPEARRKEQDFGLVRAPSDIYVTGTATLLQEAIANVIDNAIRYAPKRGRLTLTVAAANGFGQVTLIDNGPGMTAEERLCVGERFRRGNTAPSGGSGLGLAITKEIIDQHRGKFEVHEGPNSIGLTVRLSVPLSSEFTI